MKEETMREVLCDCLGIISQKVRNGSITITDIRTLTDALFSGSEIDASVKEVAGYYGQSETNVRSLIKRKILSKPKRKVYYNFTEICRKVPKSWHRTSSNTDD